MTLFYAQKKMIDTCAAGKAYKTSFRRQTNHYFDFRSKGIRNLHFTYKYTNASNQKCHYSAVYGYSAFMLFYVFGVGLGACDRRRLRHRSNFLKKFLPSLLKAINSCNWSFAGKTFFASCVSGKFCVKSGHIEGWESRWVQT